MDKGGVTRLSRREAHSSPTTQIHTAPTAGFQPSCTPLYTALTPTHPTPSVTPPIASLTGPCTQPRRRRRRKPHDKVSRVSESGRKEMTGGDPKPERVGEVGEGSGVWCGASRPSAAAGGWKGLAGTGRQPVLSGGGPVAAAVGCPPPPGPAHSPPGSGQSPAGGDPSCPPRGLASERACPLGAQLLRPPRWTPPPPPPQSPFRRLGFCRRARPAGPLHFLPLPLLRRRPPGRSPSRAAAPGSRASY